MEEGDGVGALSGSVGGFTAVEQASDLTSVGFFPSVLAGAFAELAEF